MYVFQLFDYYSGSRIILFVAFFMCVAVAWCYGMFQRDSSSLLNDYYYFLLISSGLTFKESIVRKKENVNKRFLRFPKYVLLPFADQTSLL